MIGIYISIYIYVRIYIYVYIYIYINSFRHGDAIPGRLRNTPLLFCSCDGLDHQSRNERDHLGTHKLSVWDCFKFCASTTLVDLHFGLLKWWCDGQQINSTKYMCTFLTLNFRNDYSHTCIVVAHGHYCSHSRQLWSSALWKPPPDGRPEQCYTTRTSNYTRVPDQ